MGLVRGTGAAGPHEPRVAEAPIADPIASQRDRRRKLTVVIPCFNEHRTILEVIDRVRSLPIDKSIIVVDNVSTDGTRELLRSVCSNERPVELENGFFPSNGLMPGQRVLNGDGFLLVLQPFNLGKGASVRAGVALANSDYVICQDADLEYDSADIPRLLEHAERTQAVAVFGSRLVNVRRQLDSFQLGRVVLTKVFRFLYGCPITDVATCYKLLRSDVARELHTRGSGFDLDFEIPAKLRLQGHTIREIPINYSPRKEGKKLRWRDGLPALWTLLRVRL